ncbi:MAG: chromosome partitioning protein ParB, partial [Gammaproteobacteria bacterium]|nr:chromosome partitioning protein ParB [Gammaproteobacteria bacterium]
DAVTPDGPPAGIGVSNSTDLKSLRARAWTLAARLAQRNGLSDLVVPLSGQGLGFILRDVPDPALADQLDEESLSQLSLIWWQLAACSELTLAPLVSITPHLPTESVLRQALEQQDLATIFDSVWTLDPGQTGHRLWRRLGDRDWMDLLNLMDSYRRIHRLAEERQLDLWATP